MALAHLSVRAHSRTFGHTVAAALAYRQGENLYDYRDGTQFRFAWRRKRGEVLSIGFAYGRQPAWPRNDPQAFADALECAETRVNSCISRDIEIALPRELTLAEQIQLAQIWADILAARYGCAVAFAVHASDAEGDEKNTHAHFLISTRRLTKDGTLGEKIRAFHGPAGVRGGPEIRALRAKWERTCNAELERAGHAVRIDMGRKRGGRAARHLGHKATALEREARRERHKKRGRKQPPERASAAEVVTQNQRTGGCATDRGTRLARHVAEQQLIDQAEQVAARDEMRIQLIDSQSVSEPTPIRKRGRRPRRERGPRQPRVRTGRSQQQPGDVARDDPQPEPPSVSETPADISTIEPVPEPRAVPIAARDAAPEPPTRIRWLQPTPEPRPLPITDAKAAREASTRVTDIEAPDIGTLDRLLRAVREKISKLQALWDKAKPAEAAFQGRGAWPSTQRRLTAAWAAMVRAGEPHASSDVELFATHFMTPAEAMFLLKTIASDDIERALRAAQLRAREHGQPGEFNPRGVKLQFVLDGHQLDQRALEDGQMDILMYSWTRRHVSRLPAWLQERIVEQCRTLGLPEDTEPTIRIPVGIRLVWDPVREPLSESDCVGYMRRPDKTGKLPELQSREHIEALPAAVRTLDEIYHATSLPEEIRAAALREAMGGVAAERTMLSTGVRFTLPAIEIDTIASHALGVSSIEDRFRSQSTPMRPATGTVRSGTDRRTLFPLVRAAARRVLERIEVLIRPRHEIEPVRRPGVEVRPTTEEIQTTRAHLDARLPDVLRTIGWSRLGGNWLDPPHYDDSDRVRRQRIVRALHDTDPASAPLIRAPESEEIAAAMIDEHLLVIALEQFGDHRPPPAPQSLRSESTERWQRIITRGFDAWTALVPQLARGIRNAITRLEVLALREQTSAREAEASRPQRPGPGTRSGRERE